MPKRGGNTSGQMLLAFEEESFTVQAQKKKTGRGNIDVVQIEKAKELFRKKHPQGVRQTEIANYVGCSPMRAARLIDRLSGRMDGRGCGFTVYEDDFTKPTLFYISRDTETTGNDRRPADWEYKTDG